MKKNLLLFIITIFSQYFQTYGQTGPAGIKTTDGTSSLEYWIDANQGVTGVSPITSWLDLSGNMIINTINGDPSITLASLNGLNVATFDGAGDYLQTDLSINAGTFPNLTIVCLYTPRINNAGGVWGEDDANWDRFLLDKSDFAPTTADMVSNGTGPVTGIANIFPVGSSVITTVIFQEDVIAGTTVWADGTLQSTFSSNHAPEVSNNFTVGDIGSISGVFNFDGDIAELIVFSTNINSAQRIIIDNYLSAKYGLTLAGNDLYDEDDMVNGNYDHEVAGIGRIDASNLHNDAQGTAMVRILNPNGLNDDEFLIWGHDNAPTEVIDFLDVPVALDARLKRVWRASEVNQSGTAVDVGSIDIRWDLSGLGSVDPADLRLLVDTDNDGVFTDEVGIGEATDLGGDIYEFSGITQIENNLRFTLATIDWFDTPLPIELLWFDATLNRNNEVDLEWITSSEINNDFFVLEKSNNGVDWEFLTEVNGSGNSSFEIHYNVIDPHPYLGITYYRLSQTDFDGTEKILDIKSVLYNKLSIYPNPTKNELTIAGINDVVNIKIFDLLGKELTDNTVITINENSVNVELSKFSSGSYFLIVNGQCFKFVRL